MDKNRVCDVEAVPVTFTHWLQRRRREEPLFEERVSACTGAKLSTVKRWRKGHPAGWDSMLTALVECGGPRAIDEVLLKPLGMTGARYIDEEPVVDNLFVALRALDAGLEDLARHPKSATCDSALDRLLDCGQRLGKMLRVLVDMQRARNVSAQVVEMPERGEKRA